MPVMSPKLRELLESEPFPRAYVHKFIGRNSDTFLGAVDALLDRFPAADAKPNRPSANGTYVSITWVVQVESADDVEALMAATMALPELKAML